MNASQITEARSLQTPISQSQTATDKSPAIQVQYVPALGTGGTAATCAHIAASSMTFTVDGAVPAGLDIIGTSGVFLTTAAGYDTIGELVDAINGASAWRAYLIGALRSDLSSMLLAKTSASCFGANGLTLYIDTSSQEGSVVPGTAAQASVIGTAISGEKFVNNGISGHLKDADDQCENSLLHADVQIGDGSGADLTLYLFSESQKTDGKLIASFPMTEDTLISLGRQGSATIVDGLGDKFITAKRGERLVVRVGTTSLFDAYTKFDVTGATAPLKNDRIVDELNFTP